MLSDPCPFYHRLAPIQWIRLAAPSLVIKQHVHVFSFNAQPMAKITTGIRVLRMRELNLMLLFK